MPHYSLLIRGVDGIVSFSPESPESPLLKDIISANLIMYYVIYTRQNFDFMSVKTASAYGRENGGVRLYLDGFRVFPYGDPGDDWLGLDQVRASRNTTVPTLLQAEVRGAERPLLLIPGNNQLFGALYLSQVDHPEVQLTINREGLIENEAFRQLREFARLGIFWMTIVNGRRRAEEEIRQIEVNVPTVVSSIDELDRIIQRSTDIAEPLKAELTNVIQTARHAAEVREGELISELSLLRVLASAGTMVIIFGHQLRGIVDGLATINADLRRLRSEIPDSVRERYDDIVQQLSEWRETTEDQAEQIGLLVGSDARQRRRRLVVRDVVAKVTRPLRSYTRGYGIEVINNVASDVRTPPMFESELHAILLNVFTNALKAVRDQPRRIIAFAASRDARGLTITVSDSGVGVPVGMRDDVFRPFITTSAPDPILGVGTGLGLKVVRDLLETYGGSARFVDPNTPWRTTLNLYIPQEV